MNIPSQYPTVQPVQVACTFCGASVHPRITEIQNPQTKESTKECRWVCGRCSNLVKVGRVQ